MRGFAAAIGCGGAVTSARRARAGGRGRSLEGECPGGSPPRKPESRGKPTPALTWASSPGAARSPRRGQRSHASPALASLGTQVGDSRLRPARPGWARGPQRGGEDGKRLERRPRGGEEGSETPTPAPAPGWKGWAGARAGRPGCWDPEPRTPGPSRSGFGEEGRRRAEEAALRLDFLSPDWDSASDPGRCWGGGDGGSRL